MASRSYGYPRGNRSCPADASFLESPQFMQLLYRVVAVSAVLLFCGWVLRADTNKAASKQAEQKFNAILVWATDDDKPPEKEEELKAIEPGLRDKFKFFKWKNYFQVGDRKHVTIHLNEPTEVPLSHKCKLK